MDDEKLQLELLRQAIICEQFVLHYQPCINIYTGEMVSIEALIRWQHPSAGLIYPDAFIPLAERSGLIVEIGEWVLIQACKKMKQWQNEGVQIPSVSVNVSPKQIQTASLLSLIQNALNISALNPTALDIEITESILLPENESLSEDIILLRKMGVKISLDDFGLGYSSFARLRNFKVDRIKIDKLFITNLTSSHIDQSLVRTMIALSQELGINIIAEGIEDPQTLIMLQSMGCPHGQGFHISYPMDSTSTENYFFSLQKSITSSLIKF